MTRPENFATWLRKNRREALDLVALALAELITYRVFQAVPPPALCCAPVVAALVPFRKLGRSGWWAEFLDGLPRRLIAFGATAAVLRFWLQVPLEFLWFGPLWGVIACLLTIDWTPFARFRRLNAAARILLLIAAALWAIRGFIRPTLNGTADALWYATMLHDTVLQVRSGIFPVWVGQTIYQYNGAICPIRVAPAFPYLGAALDSITLGRLAPFALQNLLIALIGGAAAFTAYACLCAVMVETRWVAASLAILYVTCPGVLGLAYNTDLYMSWTTLPLLPLVWYGTVSSFASKGSLTSLLWVAGPLALCWWGHSPIALWSTLLAGVSQVVRLILARKEPIAWQSLLVAGSVFIAIAAYPLASVLLFLPPGMSASSFAIAAPGEISYFLSQSFPGIFLPLSAKGLAYSDFQLGYALWLLLVASLISLGRQARAAAAIPLVCAVVLAILLLPLGGISTLLWSLVPAMLRNTAGNWVASRLCALTAAATVFGVASLLRWGSLRIQPRAAITVLCILGCVWSLAEATKFGDGSRASAPAPSTAQDWMRPENVQITRFSYSFFPGFPDTFTHGVADPGLENSLLDLTSRNPLTSNLTAAREQATVVSTGSFRPNPGSFTEGFSVNTTFHIEPRKSYLIDFAFSNPANLRGVLQISGPHFFREYALPEHGGSRAFGAGGKHASALPVWTTAGPEDLAVRFFPQPAAADPTYDAVGTVRLLEYSPQDLPVVVRGWTPLTAQVTSPVPAWWETPRMFQSGYSATVNGQPAKVVRTSDGLTCVSVPAGSSAVRLAYHPPWLLAFTFWLSAIATLALGLRALRGLRPFLRPSAAPS